MQPNTVNSALGVLAGERELRISIETEDILMIVVGIFVAMLCALLVAKHL